MRIGGLRCSPVRCPNTAHTSANNDPPAFILCIGQHRRVEATKRNLNAARTLLVPCSKQYLLLLSHYLATVPPIKVVHIQHFAVYFPVHLDNQGHTGGGKQLGPSTDYVNLPSLHTAPTTVA